MLGRKGQSALEYLMTYGWAILIIIIVGGVLYYYGVFSPGQLVGESKVGFTKVQVDSWSVTSGTPNGQIEFIFENRAGKEINITNVTVGTVMTGTGIEISAGDRSNFEPVSTPSISSGETYKWNISIVYEITDYPGTNFRSTGSLSGTA